ncbi:CobW family GTP-binding protein [Natronoglycomyces albus]|uniref:GTP-binding protein n=1 Tax=Natronoglycomyces albus TaxID=2811108 RepID=A0A895XLV8_9ACTN|nr:GTP-binding protein [Natronoglycomyces albus]QSB04399.1 GTP-binding protein [Natronoglycomyces albus]
MTYLSAPGAGTTRRDDLRPAVTLLAGLNPVATRDVADNLLQADPTLLVVEHELTELLVNGTVIRTVRDGNGVLEDEKFAPDHPCLSCTLREDLLPTLVRLAKTHPRRDLVVALPAAVEPEAVAAVCTWCLVDGKPVTDSVRLDSVVTVCDSASIALSLESPDDLADRGINAADNDHRALADVACRQIEYADTVVLWTAGTDITFDDARVSVLLQRLNPWAAHLHTYGLTPAALASELLRSERYAETTPDLIGRGLEGFGVGVNEPVADCGVTATVFRTRRPFHPQRLHESLDGIASISLRGRGHLWIASQHSTAVAWESAGGGVSMGSLGKWMAAAEDADWDDISPQRHVAASLNWTPEWGDRENHLAFIGVGMDVEHIHRLLSYSLLTDEEIAAGAKAWESYEDPFAGCFPLTDEDVA